MAGYNKSNNNEVMIKGHRKGEGRVEILIWQSSSIQK
jgi:hypothetical protein